MRSQHLDERLRQDDVAEAFERRMPMARAASHWRWLTD